MIYREITLDSVADGVGSRLFYCQAITCHRGGELVLGLVLLLEFSACIYFRLKGFHKLFLSPALKARVSL